ncbi:MAG: amidase [Paracoccaceae bacterium]
MADALSPDPADLTAREAISAMADGRLTAAALTDACLARIEAHDSRLGAFVHVDAAGARRAAKATDERRRRGLPRLPLDGVPVGVKDIVDVAGMPCAWGSPLVEGRRPRADSTVAARLRAAGAVIVGKTTTTEFAGYPPAATLNPRAESRTPGGSSAGSAAAVAAGLVPLAVATQTNGSVIRPAAFCGAMGYKPSFGTVARTGVMPFAPSVDHVGLIARSVDDLALLEHLAGPDGGDPDALPHGLPLVGTASSAPPLAPVLGFFEGPAWGEAAPGTAEAFAELSAAIPGIRHIATPPALGETATLLRRLMCAEGAHHLGAYMDRDRERVHPILCEMFEEGRRLPATDYLAARATRLGLRAAFGAIFEEVDALVTPATPGEAPSRETTGSPAFCSLWSYTGLPAVTLPLLAGPDGLPLGVQLVGPHGDDARLLRTARWLVRRLSEDAP